MNIPIDDETYSDKRTRTREEVKNGNPGRPQSDYENPPMSRRLCGIYRLDGSARQ